ncbi:Glycosyltransferase involved in cell wall bisynthesis [Micromonospora nigra]|uniref:Glycosyltransferase involved in cell wall bisynthesis n=1 Tax=Micromonospora nigra TaxID=145857 RepID=A0A1C6ST05_9ACTN|nr:glycosyltransferase [Micromonospora nigra]SCL32726.1 Glycosyltransferase involved in cell wall bisynthesis [Micromonospora nigra]
MTTDTSLILCDLSPFRHSTRTRKIAVTAAPHLPGTVRAVTLAQVGRNGAADDPGLSRIDGIEVEQLPVGRIDQRRRLTASIRNLATVYLPALWHLRRRVLATRARTVFVGHIALFWIGLAHRRRWGSQVILNGRERPGGIRTRGSLATWFSRVEPVLLRLVARRAPVTVVAVCESHATQFRRLGLDDVLVIRNVPLAAFAPDFVPPPPGPDLVVACVGTLYPGRGIEALIDATVTARAAGAAVRLEVTGPASQEYRTALLDRIRDAGAEAYVSLPGPCPPTEVAARIQRAHVATALYEAVDPANDSLSNKLFEGVVAGRPVIAGDLAENRALIERFAVGWSIPVEPAALGALLCELAADLPGVRAMAEHCYVTGRSEFVWEAETSVLQKRLLTAAGEQPSSPVPSSHSRGLL